MSVKIFEINICKTKNKQKQGALFRCFIIRNPKDKLALVILTKVNVLEMDMLAKLKLF